MNRIDGLKYLSDKNTGGTNAILKAYEDGGFSFPGDKGKKIRVWAKTEDSRPNSVGTHNQIAIPEELYASFLTRLAQNPMVTKIIEGNGFSGVNILEEWRNKMVILTPERIAEVVRNYPQGCDDQKEEFLKVLFGEENVPEKKLGKITVTFELEHKGYEDWNVEDFQNLLVGAPFVTARLENDLKNARAGWQNVIVTDVKHER
jgi:hypothetical protein